MEFGLSQEQVILEKASGSSSPWSLDAVRALASETAPVIWQVWLRWGSPAY